MAEEEKNIPAEPEVKSSFQLQKESWYDKVPLNLKQLDMIIVACWVAIGAAMVLVALDAMDIFHLFG